MALGQTERWIRELAAIERPSASPGERVAFVAHHDAAWARRPRFGRLASAPPPAAPSRVPRCLRHRRHPRRKIDPSRCVGYVDEADWVAPFRSAKFAVTSIDGDRATAALVERSGARSHYDVQLAKLGGRWRITGASVPLPKGH